MEELRALLQGMGFRGVTTFIASGNVIFETGSRSQPALEKKIEKALVTCFKYDISVFVRSASEVVAIAGHRAFPEPVVRSARALNVALLKDPLSPAAARRLGGLRTSIDDFHTHGREVYWLCRESQSRSKFSNAVFERALGVRTTFRGINTMQRLAQLCAPQGSEE